MFAAPEIYWAQITAACATMVDCGIAVGYAPQNGRNLITDNTQIWCSLPAAILETLPIAVTYAENALNTEDTAYSTLAQEAMARVKQVMHIPEVVAEANRPARLITTTQQHWWELTYLDERFAWVERENVLLSEPASEK